jgi:putative sterol carrier protein
MNDVYRVRGCCAVLCCADEGLTSSQTVTLSLSDDDFGKLVNGKANAQRLFMGGKLKVKGDVMKATKMEPILKKAQAVKAKL